MLQLAAVLARLGLCSVLLCWMESMALGMERLQSPAFDLYTTIKQFLIERVFQVECIRLAKHVLQSSSKWKPVNRSTSALPLAVKNPQYYREY